MINVTVDTNHQFSDEFTSWLSLLYGIPFSLVVKTIEPSLLQQMHDTHLKIQNQLCSLSPNPILEMKRFVHIKTGNPYTLICVSNKNLPKSEYIESAVYVNDSGVVFSRPYAEFKDKFRLLDE